MEKKADPAVMDVRENAHRHVPGIVLATVPARVRHKASTLQVVTIVVKVIVIQAAKALVICPQNNKEYYRMLGFELPSSPSI